MRMSVVAEITLDIQDLMRGSRQWISSRALGVKYELSHQTAYEILLVFYDRGLVERKPGRYGGFRWKD
jgi:DNA-binding IscR family transcriptional regulator